MSRNSGNGAGLEYGEMGDRLREARQARGLSLRGLAERLGVSPSLISQVETGRAKPSVSTLYAIVTELGISLEAVRERFTFAAQDTSHGLNGVAFSPDGERLMTGDTAITAVSPRVASLRR